MNSRTVIMITSILLAGLFSSPTNGFAKNSNLAVPLPMLRVHGNKIVDSKGNPVVLRGMNICDPGILQSENRWNENYIKKAASWGCTLIRIPVTPQVYRSYGKEKYLLLLDEAIKWSETYGMYTIIDWHSIGNPIQKIFIEPRDGFRTDEKEMIEFWKTIADRYRTRSAAAFYEIFNEPVALNWLGGNLEWPQWRDLADRVIDEIYKINPDAIPVVGGLDFAYNLKEAGSAPLRNKRIVFAVHPYPGHAGQPWEENWERDFGYLSDRFPMILTEFGFDPDDRILPKVYKADSDYGRRILDFAEKKGMSWTAFVFYNGKYWPMPLFKNWTDFEPTVSGEFFREKLIEKSSIKKYKQK